MSYHFVWIPKYRKCLLKGPMETSLNAFIAQKCRHLKCDILALEIMPDHVHLFVNADPSDSPSSIIQSIKGFTSRELRLKHPHLGSLPTLWTRSYFVSTAGNIASETIKRYIAQPYNRHKAQANDLGLQNL